MNGVEVRQISFSDEEFPPAPNDTENVLYSIGNRVSLNNAYGNLTSDQVVL